MNQEDVLKKRKIRKDTLKKKKRRKRYEVAVRYISSRSFEIMANDEREAVLKAMDALYKLEPRNTNTISAVVKSQRGSKIYDYHFDQNLIEELVDHYE